MDEKLLLKQFKADPGTAFVEIIRSAAGPIDARRIMDHLKAAGAPLAGVREKWYRVQKFLNVHPHIRKPTPNRYEWSEEPIPSSKALRLLSTYVLKSTPGWLTSAYVQTITDSLAYAETTGASAQSTWSEERDLQKAQVLAETTAEVESLVDHGASAADVVRWLQEQAVARKLHQIVHLGDQVPFDPETHDVEGVAPRRGAQVRVVRSGYRWTLGGREDVVVRALVRALSDGS
jgi:hypothetical protein